MREIALTKQYRERPNVRKWIIKYLTENPHISLKDMSQRYYVDEFECRHYLYFTEGRRTQARKMLQEGYLLPKEISTETPSADSLEKCEEPEQTPGKIHQQETVFDSIYHTVYRMVVPGGWIYTTTTLDSGTTTCFVPYPAEFEEGRDL